MLYAGLDLSRKRLDFHLLDPCMQDPFVRLSCRITLCGEVVISSRKFVRGHPAPRRRLRQHSSWLYELPARALQAIS
jgi:hypothetical protein